MKAKRHFPLWAAFVVDFLVFAALFGLFMLVHYGGSQLRGDPIIQGEFTKPNKDSGDKVIPSAPVMGHLPDAPFTSFDTSGDFGARFPMRFLQDSSSYILQADEHTYVDPLIRDYLNRMGYTYYDAAGEGEFIGLYQSHNIFVSVLQVDTVMASLTSGNQHKERYFIYDIYVRNIDNLYTYAVGNRDSVEGLVKGTGKLSFTAGLPIAVVNGDYWGNTSHCLLAERNGQIIGANPHYDYILSDLCVLYYDGTMETLKPDQFDWSIIRKKTPYQIWNFGPGLLDAHGVSYGKYSNDSYGHDVVNARHPRTILGYYEPGHYSFVSIDGRSDVSDGMTLPEAALILQNMGCKQAYNMDGGDSSYAYFGGNIIRQNWDRADDDNARWIYDIICVGEIK